MLSAALEFLGASLGLGRNMPLSILRCLGDPFSRMLASPSLWLGVVRLQSETAPKH